MKREISKEQFFTTDKNALFCLSKVNIKNYERVIEPSAGNGSFSNKIENCIAYDIEPMADNIIKQDFLKLKIERGEKTLVIGNPPFGRQSSLATKFINKAAEFADVIAFILPLSFKKDSMINRLNKHLHLKEVHDLEDCEFYFNDKKYNIPCAFFIFEFKEKLREVKKPETTDDFKFVPQSEADDSIRRVGYYAGRIEPVDSSPSSHYFVKWNNKDAREIFSKIKFQHDNTVGARSISKNEMISSYNKEKASR